MHTSIVGGTHCTQLERSSALKAIRRETNSTTISREKSSSGANKQGVPPVNTRFFCVGSGCFLRQTLLNCSVENAVNFTLKVQQYSLRFGESVFCVFTLENYVGRFV